MSRPAEPHGLKQQLQAELARLTGPPALTLEQVDQPSLFYNIGRYAWATHVLLEPRSPLPERPFRQALRHIRERMERLLSLRFEIVPGRHAGERYRELLLRRALPTHTILQAAHMANIWFRVLLLCFARNREIFDYRLEQAVPGWLRVIGPAAEAVQELGRGLGQAAAAVAEQAGRAVIAAPASALEEMLRKGWPLLLLALGTFILLRK